MDILEFHHTISKNFKIEISQHESFKDHKRKLENILKLPYLSQRVRNAVEDDLLTIENKIKRVTSLKFYFIEIGDIVNRYIDCISKPMLNFFFEKSARQTQKLDIIQEFWEVLNMYKKFYPFVCPLIPPSNANLCHYCQTDHGFVFDDIVSVCFKCFSENMRYINHQKSCEFTFKMSSKYVYDRNSQFRDCLARYQGEQKLSLPSTLLPSLNAAFQMYRIDHVTYVNVVMMLRNLGYGKFADDYMFIHHQLTKEPLPDVSHIEEKLLNDFDLFNSELKTFEHLNKKNFSTQYILLQLLQLHGIAIHPDHLSVIKSNERKIFTNKICKTIFADLGWNFTSLL